MTTTTEPTDGTDTTAKTNYSAPTGYNETKTELEWYFEECDSYIEKVDEALAGAHSLDKALAAVRYTIQNRSENWDTEEAELYHRTAALLEGLNQHNRETKFFERESENPENNDRIALAVYDVSDKMDFIVYADASDSEKTPGDHSNILSGVNIVSELTEDHIHELTGTYPEVDDNSAWT